MRMMPPERIEAFDRRTAAIHEAGHIVMAGACGLHASGYIFRHGDPDLESKSWLGKTDIFHRKLDPWTGTRIGVAGRVAELCWERVEIGDVLDRELWAEEHAMSPSDWRMAGCQAGELGPKFMRAVEFVVQRFDRNEGTLWPSLIRVARELMIEARHNRRPDDAALQLPEIKPEVRSAA